MDQSKSMWMVRAGESAMYIQDFLAKQRVSIGWQEAGDMSALSEREEFARHIEQSYPALSRAQRAMSTSQVFRFYREMKVGDEVVTYDNTKRVYHVGEIRSDARYLPQADDGHSNVRDVRWTASVSRDQLSAETKNSLGAISTLFLVPETAANEIRQRVSGVPLGGGDASAVSEDASARDGVEALYRDLQNRSLEFISDRVNALAWDEVQELVAGLLRAMGYKTRIALPGPDLGTDILASPDGFGFEEPRIFVEVKHRDGSIGAPQLRSFLGGRHEGDKCLYVSTGGFTKDARYEADRSRIPLALMDLDDLVRALIEHYERLDHATQRLLPLRRVYWPM